MTQVSHPHSSRAIVDLAAIAANWRSLAAMTAGECGAAVKANAYGLGVEAVAPALARAGCRSFFVAHITEGMRLRQFLADVDIYVLNGFSAGSQTDVLSHRLTPVLASSEEIAEWATISGSHHPCAIQVDTGMNRLGLTFKEAAEFAQNVELQARSGASLVLTHLACADESDHPLNAHQRDVFQAVSRLFPHLRASLANSSGLFLGTDYHFDLARPGIALYGGAVVSGKPSPMRNVLTLTSPILQIRTAPAGETVGYGATCRLRRDSRIAILSCGYADGLHRRASGGNMDSDAFPPVLHGRPAPILGRISMDLMAVDVTEISNARRGDHVELVGPARPLQNHAASMATIDYEVLTSLGHRLDFTYVPIAPEVVEA